MGTGVTPFVALGALVGMYYDAAHRGNYLDALADPPVGDKRRRLVYELSGHLREVIRYLREKAAADEEREASDGEGGTGGETPPDDA